MRRRKRIPLPFVDALIDTLTNSIVDVNDAHSLPTWVVEAEAKVVKQSTPRRKWRFQWPLEAALDDRKVYKLVLQSDPATVHGLVSLSDLGDHIYVHLVESAPHNVGRRKRYLGVAGNLFAYACLLSLQRGYGGCVAFHAKTALKEHYAKSLGAVSLGLQKMCIFEDAAAHLLRHYYPDALPTIPHPSDAPHGTAS